MDWKPLSKTDDISLAWPSAAPSLIEGVSLGDFMEKLNGVVYEYGLGGATCDLSYVNPPASFGGYYSNSDQNRAKALQQLLIDPTTKGIWAGRGGYGGAEIIQIFEQQNFTLPSDRVIPLIGFSDFTVFHLLASKCKWPTLHGPLANFNSEMNEISGEDVNDLTSIRPLIDILSGKVQEVTYTLQVLNPDSVAKYTADSINTKILGGNFSVVQRSNGTPIQLNADGSIIFFEDTEENIYRLRSLLTGVALTGMLDKVVAIFFGDFPVSGGTLQDLLMDFSKTLKEVRGVDVPILLGVGFGHGPVNQVLPLGTLTVLDFLSSNQATIKVSTNKSAYTAHF